jgi:two-component system, cell cycle response regulator
MANIVLVDDDTLVRSMYADFLRSAGHTVFGAAGVEQAKTVLSGETQVDLLITDLILPSGDGIELLSFAKAQRPDAEVIVITALDKVEPAVRAIKNGACDYLVKPIRPEVLAHAVSRALAQRALLTENADLRRSISLLEAGQRIATILERDRLAEATGLAFHQQCGADAVCIYQRQDNRMELFGSWGVAAADLPIVVSAIHTKSNELGPFSRSVSLPVGDQNDPIGQVVLLYASAMADERIALAPFLVRHVAMALRNLGRMAEVEDLIYLDPLTHLFNSRYLETTLRRVFEGLTDESPPFAVLFLDLDYFKSINDTHGHLVGSRVLVEVARVLKSVLREHDIVCRWGGDEFVILLKGTDSGTALKVAERIRRSIEVHNFLAREGLSVRLTTCIGVASFPEHAVDQSALLDFADRAMYRGKKGGRNVIYLASTAFEQTPTQRHDRRTDSLSGPDAPTLELKVDPHIAASKNHL